MKLFHALTLLTAFSSAIAFDLDETIDRIDAALVFSPANSDFKARLSGRFDAELYEFGQPAPGLIYSEGNTLLNPRLALFLDVQAGPKIYFFSQARLDRGFDPSQKGAQIRIDEYALRLTPWEDARFNLQVGKFATAVGNWVPRHLSWENPFVTAPLPYENITPANDKVAPSSLADFIRGFHPTEKFEYLPIIWGPNYSSGVSVSGRVDRFDYAMELKNTALASRPESWNITTTGFDHPEVDGRVGFRPNQMWNFGFSASEGTYLRGEAEKTLPHGRDVDDYHEFLLGQDASFAWHHLQLWAECYETRFEVPRVRDADTFAYYLEAKYQFTAQFFGALRWNQQLFDTIEAAGGNDVRWGADVVRIDVAGGYRFTAHTQVKLQYSFQRETTGPRDDNHLFAAQFTVRF
jgi:hypothetical protein